MPRLHRPLLLLLFAVVVLLTGGCTYERVVSDSWDGLRQLSEQKGGSDRAAQRAALMSDDPGWAILMTTFEGEQARQQATQTLSDLRTQQQVPDLWVRHDAGNVLLYRGRYGSADDTQARADLRQTRMLKVGKRRPFQEAQIVPVGVHAGSADDEFNLRQHRGMYTLQIAFFDEAGGPQFRASAEQYARSLRQENLEAYYYHGPHLSLVTVGLFTEADFQKRGSTMVYGPRIKQLQQRFGHNLGNGATVIEKLDGKEIGVQPSFLVRVPD